MSSALSLEKSLTVAYLGPEATFTHQAAIRRFGSSLRYTAAEDHRRRLHRGQQEPRGLRRGAGGELDRGRRHAHAGHVRGQRPARSSRRSSCRCSIACWANARAHRSSGSTPIRRPWASAATGCNANLPHVEIIETSSNARSAELAAKDKFAAPPPSPACWPPKNTTSRPRARHPGQPGQRHPVPGAGPPMRSAHRRRPHQPDVQHRGRGGRLYHALAPFRRYRMNMTKIESRPSKRKAWEYFFFVDCDGHSTTAEWPRPCPARRALQLRQSARVLS